MVRYAGVQARAILAWIGAAVFAFLMGLDGFTPVNVVCFLGCLLFAIPLTLLVRKHKRDDRRRTDTLRRSRGRRAGRRIEEALDKDR